ncbi:hypothetical protein Leryth_018238 [Lithospermum erythrorhizon]|nr:hypothetical protein Leryth_018238 [Lithospermum erythrorhizon]
MRGHKIFKLCLIIFVNFSLSNLSEARQYKKHPSAVVVGSVYCDSCFQHSVSRESHFIPGAVVAVECFGTNTIPKYKKEVSTNEHGKFIVHLPLSVSKNIKKIKRCSVKLIKSSEPLCAVASSATSSVLNLKSIKEGKHIFSAGVFTFKPLKQPEVSDQKPSVHESKAFESQKSSISNPNDLSNLPPFGNPPTSNLTPVVKGVPPLPQLPQPSLCLQLHTCPLPRLPGIPFLPPWPPQKASTTKGTTKT